MANLNGFNANEVDPLTDFEPIPAGEYLAMITGSEMKTTKSGSGSYLELTFQVLEGKYQGRLLWSRLNLDNPNPIAVQMARAELSTICRAISVMAPNDSVELHNLPLQIVVKCRKREDTGDINNEIKGYQKKKSVTVTREQTEDSIPPWERK